MSLVLIAALVVVVVLIVFGGVVLYFCSKRRKDQNAGTNPPYSVAMSNHLFKGDITKNELPCLNCRLIEMGDMACYQELCPQCGQEPPGKGEYLEQQKFSHLQKLEKAQSLAAEENEDAASEVAQCSKFLSKCNEGKTENPPYAVLKNQQGSDEPSQTVEMTESGERRSSVK
ncbi:hypothetical protein TCAL_09764 [Tigriopus californicus]|uniref:Uncharacterized protein n=1 Tax=Tigriopus californicus TaxID=6832 RepID=A0A553PJS3_TIGCA|nr:uncharacterized protein LOC131890137 isoform X1 [Tigriopus californicus]XP_059095409.1 uncharacterized protein LOC131890137 isoform X1 [Tigriopus californicus]TRY77923.1 hypothetical protein TCAL_09764 [Tigriopus californicus]|eukprot:TCALIF_09764-PA protein Name:"Protein of unknown function" AED:0.00 eAED:0.00 QI:158/1/1/1/1/1/2/538/171